MNSMKETNSITKGSVSEPQLYHYPGIACTAVAIPFLIPGEGDGRERVYHRYEQHKGDCHAVVSWAPGQGGDLSYPDLEAPLVKHYQDIVPVTGGGAA